MKHLPCALLFLSLSFGANAIANCQATKQPPAKQPPSPTRPKPRSVEGTAVFAVSKDLNDATIDPIVIFNKGQYLNPLADDEAFIKQVETRYFRKGQKYRLIFGGTEAGTVTLKDRLEFGLTTSATLDTSIRLNSQVHALATSSNTLGAKQNSRRTPTADERAAMLNLMKEAYRLKKLASAAIAKVTVNNITALDVDGDGQAELIGSFAIAAPHEISHDLFLIAEKKSGQYQNSLVWYNKGTEESLASRRLVDILDLDSDGTAEVFTINSYYESTDFTIYKKVNGVWKSVYQGGAFGV
jgi:hypothetical protein